ncbi:concanavalin A-like lectin/glucanase [Metschnikowia bicuspidata var. bicuspidata NRRL YB-4993]|uniref:Concanavalin A-like lectin/glucanase n=1 Tax=Metschnikowia bicuspidata var. bicuspidata NRRL YB-4993 TaxID=869754 RepID=A0A1A0HBF6_9ASCO|nr:concanavalin A-like lectin/glucanase [Metschnikowia bicuspidata var. bicuspidata NRRL YB-4993]OBA21469.1 concanavalin A-like lectin/glucanase [Metschnikowia bicuspidata var. bicuspidata NRRL YB-4993]
MSALRTRVLMALVSLASLVAVYWFVFMGKPEEFSPEEINDMFQNKKSEVSVKRVELPEHAISSPYLDQHTLKLANWDLEGDVVVQNGQHISLTSDHKHQASRMFLKAPVEAESFEMELTFHIHSEEKLLPDGMAVWFTADPLPLGDVFGVQNNFKGLGIFMDTFQNGRRGGFPLVNAQYSSSSLFYDKHTDGMDSMIASCLPKPIVNPALGKTRMRIVHTRNGYLSVDFNHDPDQSSEWKNCFSVMDVVLPEKFYIGISAETGELYENVDIIESKIYALYLPDFDHYIESIDELEHIMQQQAPVGNQGVSKERRRKSISRLRNAERRIKENERAHRLAKYGDPEATFVHRWVARIKTLFKYSLYMILFLLVLWIARIAIKSRKGRRSRKAVGLLD